MTIASTDSADARPAKGGKSQSKAAKSGPAGELFELGKTIVYALLIALVLRVVLFQPFTIPSASMEPALYEGDYIIVSKFAYGWSRNSIPLSPPLFNGRVFGRAPTRGDVVVFKLPREEPGKGHPDYIKRLIGLPGDRIQVKQGQVFINGAGVPRVAAGVGPASCPNAYGVTPGVARFSETLPSGKKVITNDCTRDVGDADNTATYVVPANCYFMMGDNRDNSLDSRFPPDQPGGEGERLCGWNHDVDSKVGFGMGVGFVPAENLVGRADLILLSWRPGASLFKPWTWVMNARPSRFFHPLG